MNFGIGMDKKKKKENKKESVFGKGRKSFQFQTPGDEWGKLEYNIDQRKRERESC